MDSEISLSSPTDQQLEQESLCSSDAASVCSLLQQDAAPSRLLQTTERLARQYDASLRAAPCSISAQILIRHRRALDEIGGRLVGILPRPVAEPADDHDDDENEGVALITIWHDADAFRRQLRRLRYHHASLLQILAESSQLAPAGAQPAASTGSLDQEEVLTELMAVTRLHLWDLAQLEADLTARIDAFPYSSETKLDGMIKTQIGATLDRPNGDGAGDGAGMAPPGVAAAEDGATARKGGLPAWQLRRISGIIEASPGQQISVPVLAQQIGLSPSHFTRAFKISMGTSPARWLLSKRLDFAKVLLLETEQSLAEIAMSCGFSEPSHFTKRFRQLIGVTPGAWRRQHK